MDEMVRLAMAKWPNVPHCYGWLALDSRGNWRMLDERAQALKLPGDKIHHVALIGFINRNYEVDAKGNWYFQNGPQRVYVNLAATPFILHLDGAANLVDHTGCIWPHVEAIWLDDDGRLIAQFEKKIAQLDDRDLTNCLPFFTLHGTSLHDEAWQTWMAGSSLALEFNYAGKTLPVLRLPSEDLPQFFGFCSLPQTTPNTV